jgi:hypothetical protein
LFKVQHAEVQKRIEQHRERAAENPHKRTSAVRSLKLAALRLPAAREHKTRFAYV